MKSSKHFRERGVFLLYNNIKQEVDCQLAKELPGCDRISFTTDHWTSRANEPYQSLTLHFITSEFELKRFLVTVKSFEGRSISQAITLATDQMMQDLQLPQGILITMTTDAANNMKRAMADSSYIDSHVICLDHIINTCINKALECTDELKDLIVKVKKYFY